MRVRTQLKLLGTKLIQGKRDPNKTYMTVSFLDEMQLESVNIMTENADVYNALTGITDSPLCDCEFDLRLGKYTNCRLLSCKVVEPKKS